VTGFAAACLAYGVLCTALLVVALGCIDDIKTALGQEKALRTAGDKLLSREQIVIRDTAVATGKPVRDVARHIDRALWAPPVEPA
jgi:hypothetical protein